MIRGAEYTVVRERMGSGGPRGLQILVSGASGVRGGFDSHAFPPLPSTHRGRARARRLAGIVLALGLCGWAAAAAPRVARAAVADSLATPAARPVDVVGGAPAPVRADSARQTPWHEQPRFVMARSLLVPGWGQLHNRAWFKAIVVAGLEAFLVTRVVRQQSDLDQLLSELDAARARQDLSGYDALANEYNALLAERLGNEWKLGGVIAYAMVDAYVDAHFRGFDVEFRNDPALPAGTSPAGSQSGGGGAGLRLSLRWDF
jgi:uncharacterized protein DUF5683